MILDPFLREQRFVSRIWPNAARVDPQQSCATQHDVIQVTDTSAAVMYKQDVTNVRDEATKSEAARRGGFQPSAKKLGRAGSHDRTSLHASPVVCPSPPRSPVYWHRELPPLDAEPLGEHTIEAAGVRVPHTLSHADEMWNRCYEDLMLQARNRLEQEIARLGGNYAHVLDEHVESKYDGATGEGWLRGRFRYMLYRQPTQPTPAAKALHR